VGRQTTAPIVASRTTQALRVPVLRVASLMPLKTVVQLRAPELLAHGPAIRRIEEQLRRNPALRLISPMLLEIGVKLHGQVLRPRNPAVQGIAMLFPDRMAQDNRMRKRTAAKLRVPVRLRTIL
jgi:hypothetical protein